MQADGAMRSGHENRNLWQEQIQTASDTTRGGLKTIILKILAPFGYLDGYVEFHQAYGP